MMMLQQWREKDSDLAVKLAEGYIAILSQDLHFHLVDELVPTIEEVGKLLEKGTEKPVWHQVRTG